MERQRYWSIALPEGVPNNIFLFGLLILVSTFYAIAIGVAMFSKNPYFVHFLLALVIPTIMIVIVCSNVIRGHYGYVLKKGDYKNCKYTWKEFETLPKDKIEPFILWCNENLSDVYIKESIETFKEFKCRMAKFKTKEELLLTVLTWS